MEGKNTHREATLRQTLHDDLKHGDFWKSLRKDWAELKAYSLDDDRRTRLAAMGPLKRAFFTAWWVLRQMILRLTPARRILVVLGVLLLFINTTVQGDRINNKPILGGLFLLLVILLELKDRLLAWDELQAGRKVQRELLPDTSPEIPGWSVWISTRPANEVGGDLVDYLQTGPDRTGLVMADISGKGLSAALVMAKLQTIIRTLAGEYSDIPQFASRVNEAFRREHLPNAFASMVYFELSPGSGSVRYVNAGHPPVAILRAGTLTFSDKGDAAIGLIAQTGYRERFAELAPGDALVCYSDGLTEARNSAGEFYGTERLASLLPSLSQLSAQDMGNAIMAAIDRFAGDVHPHDDLSLIVLKRL